MCTKPILESTKNVTLFEDKDTFLAYVGVNLDLKRFIVAFRGTVNTKGVLEDIKIVRKSLFTESAKNGIAYKPGDDKKKLGSIGVHGGFLGIYLLKHQELVKRVHELLKLAPYKDIKTMSIVGHSMGGSLANLAAVEFAHEFPQFKIVVVTTETPRVGNVEFAKYLTFDLKDRVTIYRYINYNDRIPHLPSSLLGYRHAGREYWSETAGSTDKIKICALVPELKSDKICSKGIPHKFENHNTMLGKDLLDGGYVLKNPEQY
jgi:predicted lipase